MLVFVYFAVNSPANVEAHKKLMRKVAERKFATWLMGGDYGQYSWFNNFINVAWCAPIQFTKPQGSLAVTWTALWH